jgi:hypothetical protein
MRICVHVHVRTYVHAHMKNYSCTARMHSYKSRAFRGLPTNRSVYIYPVYEFQRTP